LNARLAGWIPYGLFLVAVITSLLIETADLVDVEKGPFINIKSTVSTNFPHSPSQKLQCYTHVYK